MSYNVATPEPPRKASAENTTRNPAYKPTADLGSDTLDWMLQADCEGADDALVRQDDVDARWAAAVVAAEKRCPVDLVTHIFNNHWHHDCILCCPLLLAELEMAAEEYRS